MVLSLSQGILYSRLTYVFRFPQWSDAALWKSCGCSAAPLCVTVDKRRHPAATDAHSRHTMSINQVPSSGMRFAPKRILRCLFDCGKQTVLYEFRGSKACLQNQSWQGVIRYGMHRAM